MALPLYEEKHPTERAEGTCKGLPYNTELASINGVEVHFWTGDLKGAELENALAAASDAIRWRRDVVGITYSAGAPAGFWAHEDVA